jgi:sigma-B regulation protein RsbU (phosphoserine phosphatase)
MEVQQRLLPARPPEVRGLDVAGHSTYCDETGGDYYDFLVIEQPDDCERDRGRLLIALGDVMGHGVAAALVMAGARAVLRDRAGNAGSLGELMSRLNALLASDLDGTRFMTMHLAVIDARAGTYRIASAGHDPAIIYDTVTGEFTEIDEGDLPLGVMSDSTYEEHAYDGLRPGQVILVGTEGIWEMPSDSGEQFGKDRLRDVIRASAAGSAADVVKAVLDAIHTVRGECRPMDDVTFVVIKHVGVPQTPREMALPAGGNVDLAV